MENYIDFSKHDYGSAHFSYNKQYKTINVSVSGYNSVGYYLDENESIKLLKWLATKLNFGIAKRELGSGWHPDDGPCIDCGADQGEECRDNMYYGD